jgi:hypothetical protein
MRRPLRLVAVAAVLLGVVSCSSSADDTSPTGTPPTTEPAPVSPVTPSPVTPSPVTPSPATSTPATSTPATSTPATASPATAATPDPADTLSPEARALELCGSSTSFVLGRVASAALDETSGLVASRRHRDVLWAHNDGADDVGVFAVGADGSDLGFHPLVVDGAVDVEDMAMLSGPDGDDILLADIGDNGSRRPSIRVYRFAEPDPASTQPITDVEVLEFVYPDRPHNAEVLLVDEDAGRVVIVTKEQRRVEGIPPELGPTEPSFVFEGPLDGHDGVPIELTPVGMLDAPLLETRTVATPPHPTSLLGLGGLPTGGDVSADGALVALRTYETIWVFPRLPGRTVAEALAGDPCQAAIAPETQGEAVAFTARSLVTISEGVAPDIFELRP